MVVDLTWYYIFRSHPIGRQNKNGNIQIISKFKNWKVNNTEKRKLKSSSIFVTEDLTRYRCLPECLFLYIVFTLASIFAINRHFVLPCMKHCCCFFFVLCISCLPLSCFTVYFCLVVFFLSLYLNNNYQLS